MANEESTGGDKNLASEVSADPFLDEPSRGGERLPYLVLEDGEIVLREHWTGSLEDRDYSVIEMTDHEYFVRRMTSISTEAIEARMDGWTGSKALDAALLRRDIKSLLTLVEFLREGFREIKAHYGQVCPDFEVCSHPWCNASYGAWATADERLGGPGSGGSTVDR